MTSTTDLLHVEDLRVDIATAKGGLRTVVDDVAFSLAPGERMAIVGESGSGKSMTAAAILGLLPARARVSSGRIVLDGTELTALPPRQMRDWRGSVMGLIPQDPMASLNPVHTIGWQIAEAVTAHEAMTRREVKTRSCDLLERVGITNAASRLSAFPHEFSGGMRQRVLIAMALAQRPRLLIADEATTALDVTIQAQVLDLIDHLTSEAGSAVILITHDLSIAAGRSDTVTVMRTGRIVESGPAEVVLHEPRAAYTQMLLAASPRFDRPRKSLFPIDGSTEKASVR
ncbi:ABC transporter ATP-binding protein [Mycolicibacterium sp.]|uniref:ABC transporter ATP-binding protein n=1 Tax=Mycolicibacterium sp. TaxID=2320850 RepID=UPI0037C5B560